MALNYATTHAEYLARKGEQYITAEEAQKLGVGKAEWQGASGAWYKCGEGCGYNKTWGSSLIQYRAIKQPEPVEPHAELKAMYAQQVKDGTLKDFIWSFKNKPEDTETQCINNPVFSPTTAYFCTPISEHFVYKHLYCQVRNDDTGELKTITRETAKELQAETKDVCDWFNTFGGSKSDNFNYRFDGSGIYTYKLRSTVKLTVDDEPAKMLTPAQCEAERLARIDTHSLQRKGWSYRWFDSCVESAGGFVESNARWGIEYRLIRKQPVKVEMWCVSGVPIVPVGNDVIRYYTGNFRCNNQEDAIKLRTAIEITVTKELV